MGALIFPKQEHDRIKLLSRLEESKDETPQEVRELYNTVTLELKIHESLEETLL